LTQLPTAAQTAARDLPLWSELGNGRARSRMAEPSPSIARREPNVLDATMVQV
jgi:hypothetical protein